MLFPYHIQARQLLNLDHSCQITSILCKLQGHPNIFMFKFKFVRLVANTEEVEQM